jgi:hypothetical protein
MKHTLLTVCCLLVMTATMTAQNVRKKGRSHELSIYGLIGYSPMVYTLNQNGYYVSGSMGGGAGLGYTFNINYSLGIVTGVEMATYGAEASFDDVSGKYTAETGNREIRFSYSLTNYREKQSITVFSIPVMARYGRLLRLLGGTVRFYAAGGFKFGFPISAKADVTPGMATTSGYYPHEDITYANMPHHGFVSNTVLPDTKKDLELGLSTALALETGVRFILTNKINLYAGAYFDYGLNSIRKTDSRRLLEYNSSNEATFIHNSVFDTDLANKVNLMSIGLKLRIGFKL